MKRPSSTARATLAIALAVALTTPALAQTCLANGAAASCTVNVTTTLTVPTILRLTMPAGSTPFGTVTMTDFDNGYAQVAGPTVTIKANQAWRVQLSSSATFWSAVTTDIGNPARATKPIADLQWSAAAGGPYTGTIATGVQIGGGNGTGGTVLPLFFRSLWGYSLDTPGNYSVAVTFTLLSP